MTSSAALLAWVGLLAVPCAADEVHYRLDLNGQRAGEVRETRHAGPNGTVTDSDSTLRLRRLDTTVEIREHTHVEEDADGHLRRYALTIGSGRSATRVEAEVDGGVIRVRDRPDAPARDQALDRAAGPLLGPEGVRLATREWLRSPQTPLRFLAMTDEAERPHRLERRFIGRADTPDRYRVEERSDDEDEPSALVVDDQGEVWSEREQSPLGLLELRRVIDAEGTSTGAAVAPPSIDAIISQPADRRLPFPREIEALTLTLTFKGPIPSPDAFDDPDQRLEQTPDSHVRLLVDRQHASRSPAPSHASLDANALFDADDPVIRGIAADIRARHPRPLEQLQAIRETVARRLSFDAGFTIAPASTVWSTGRGSCVAYATLSATLARALGRPARVVYGLVYADGAWVGHAWAEVYVADHWEALDAALWSPTRVDATHLALARSDGSEGLTQGLTQLGRVFGRMTAHIESYTVHGRMHGVSPTPSSPIDAHGAYVAEDLGVRLRPPPGYTEYQDLTAHYPDATVVSVANAEGRYRLEQITGQPPAFDAQALLAARYGRQNLTRATLREGADGRLTLRLPNVTVLVVSRASERWILTGTGRAAADADFPSRLELDPEP